MKCWTLSIFYRYGARPDLYGNKGSYTQKKLRSIVCKKSWIWKYERECVRVPRQSDKETFIRADLTWRLVINRDRWNSRSSRIRTCVQFTPNESRLCRRTYSWLAEFEERGPRRYPYTIQNGSFKSHHSRKKAMTDKLPTPPSTKRGVYLN